MTTDAQAEAFLEQDLSNLDFCKRSLGTTVASA
jgi:predicted DNA binding CopG/RHH family protein